MQSTPEARTTPEPPIQQVRSGMDHPILPLSYAVSVNDRRLEGTGLSMIGGTCKGLLDPSLNGTRRLASLQFSFEGFTVSVPAEIQLQIFDGDAQGEVDFAFVDPAGPHLPQLRFILNSFIAGDIVQFGDALQVNTQTKVAKSKPGASVGFGHFLRQSLRYTTVAALTLGLVATAALTIQNRVLTRMEARPAVVTAGGHTLRAPAAGQLDYVNQNAEKGDIAFSILSTTGAHLSVGMPCDCDIGNDTLTEGATILAGEPVMTLLDETAAPEIRAVMSYEGLREVLGGSTIKLDFTDGTRLEATLGAGVAGQIARAEPGDSVEVTLAPVDPASAVQPGDLATVRIARNLSPLFQSTVASVGAAVSTVANTTYSRIQSVFTG